MSKELYKMLSNKDLSLDNFKNLYGHGGIDLDGERYWNGNYYKDFSKGSYGLNYNYYVDFKRVGNRRNTKCWNVVVYICLFYSNGKEIKLLDEKVTTLKKAKKLAYDTIISTNRNYKYITNKVNDYLNLTVLAKPVFIHKENDLIFVGTTYNNISTDMRHYYENQLENWLWFNNDIPNYKISNEFYSLSLDLSDKKYRIYKAERSYCSYSGSLFTDEKLVIEMLSKIKDIEKFSYLFNISN